MALAIGRLFVFQYYSEGLRRQVRDSLTVALQDMAAARILQLYILIHSLFDYLKAAVPEVFRFHINTESSRQVHDFALAGASEKFFILRDETLALIEVDCVHSKPEQKAESVGEIVEMQI